MDVFGLRIAVTGASGHIGNVVCRELQKKGAVVRAIYRSDERALVDLDIEKVLGDVSDKTHLTELMKGCHVVVNCAALVSITGSQGGRVFQTNVNGVQNLIEACLLSGVKRIVHVSSVHAVTELPHSEPYDESRPYKLGTDTAYDFSKAEGEKLLLNAAATSNIEVVIVRPSCVIGPFDFKPSLMGAALMDFYNGKMPFLPFGGYDMIDVRDIAASIVSALEMGQNKEIYLLSGTYYTFSDLTTEIGQITTRKMPKMVMPHWLLWLLVPPASLFFKWRKMTPAFTYESLKALKDGHPNMNNSKARRLLNHNVRPLKESLTDFFDWQRAHKQIN
jgi:dihydroflavonol-4-reductase